MTRSLFKWRQLLVLLFPLIGITASPAASQPQVTVDKGPDVQTMPFDFIYTPPFQYYSTNAVFEFGSGLTITAYHFGQGFTVMQRLANPADFLVYNGIESPGVLDFVFHGQAPITGMWIDNYPSGAGMVFILFGQGGVWFGAVEIDQSVSINPATDYNGHGWFVQFNTPNIDHVQVIGRTDVDAFTTVPKPLK